MNNVNDDDLYNHIAANNDGCKFGISGVVFHISFDINLVFLVNHSQLHRELQLSIINIC